MPLMFDSEPFTSACYGGGISLHTTNALRIYQQTPLDTYERLKLNNLQPQLEFIACLLHGLADLDSIPNDVAYPATRFGPTDWGFASLKAIICRYNVTSAWYDPFPHPDAVVRIVFGQPGSVIDFVAKPNDDGVLVIKGVKPYVQGLIEAYIIDKRTGAIEYVSDLGYYAFGGTGVPDPSSPSPREYFPYREETVKYLSVFRTGSAALFNILNPSTLAHEGSVEVYNFLSHGPLIQYNIDIAWPEVMVYVEQNTPFEIIIRGIEKSPLGGFVYPFGVLVNSSLERPSGFGYIVHAGQTLILKNTPFLLLKDTIYLQSQRFSILSSFHASNERIEKYNSLSIHFLKQAEEALKAKRYSLAYACTLTSWSYAMRSYWSTMDLTFEVISTIVFFIFLLIPFSFLGERLLLFYGGLKRLISVMIIIIVSLMILYTLHPGFHISTNVPIIVISSSILIISIFVLILIFLVSKEASSEFSDQRLGIHTIKVSRGGLLSVALSTGIQNMRKRRFRTILTLTSLTIIVFATISFTSLSAITVLHRAELELSVPYNGILIRKRPWSPISEHLYLSLFERFKDGAHVLPRTWIIPPQQTLMLGPKAIAQAVLAVSPEEDILTNISKVLIHGRWFNQNEYRSCIISESLAKLLGADIGASLNFYGINISIVGIMDGNLLWNGLSGIIDLDKEAITPQNIMASATETGGMGAVVEVPHIVGDFVIIVPYKLALEYFNSLPYSIAIKFKDSSIVVPTAEELSLGVSTQIYAGLTSTNKVVIFRPTFGYMSIGTQFILAPIVIVALTIFNLMLGAIYERMRETSILSSLGLAPLHITGMFLAESVLYSILSAVLGYVIGNAAMSIMSAMKAIPEGFYPNYSSVFIIIITALCVLVVISSTAYPALKAGKLVTPSLETRWRLQTKPVGDEWSIPLPFIAFEEEVGAILAYLEEYFNAHGSAYGANFATLETALEEGSKTLRAKIWLAPFEMGIRQSVNIFAIPEAGTKYKFLIRIHKESGFRDTWITVNTRFIDLLRKQFLIWRSLQPSEKARYIQASSIKSKAG
jgi:ABC-type antimicrobial peptide transport system permease subunit